MLVFAASDKGGTGRSVTSCNILYRSALQGGDVCYLDYDFGSPTAGAVFGVDYAAHGVEGGLHSYIHGTVPEPQRVDVWGESDRIGLRDRPAGSGRLVLIPGDRSGGEFPITNEMVDRCGRLFLRLEEEFDLCLVDLSAGRSYATEMVLKATAQPALRSVRWRWLIFQRWTRQHVLAAASLIHGHGGILDIGTKVGHERGALEDSLRIVRTAFVDPDSQELAGLAIPQLTWLRACHKRLQELASEYRVGRTVLLGNVPLDPVLQWQEQLISDNDVSLRRIANRATVESFDSLAKQIVNDTAWETL